MSQELYYDRGLKKWRGIDSDTGEIGGIVKDKDPYYMVKIYASRNLAGMLGINTLGFFNMLIGFIEYKNRVEVSYSKLTQEYGLSSATIKKHLDTLKKYNIILEQTSPKGKRYYLVNGEYVFRGGGGQLKENLDIFKQNAMELKKKRVGIK